MENASKALIIAGAILLAILLISLGIMIFTQAQDVVSGSGMTEARISAFNDKFLKYEGTKKGTMVKALIQEVMATNSESSNNDSIQVTINGEVPNTTKNVTNNNSYKIEMDYATGASNETNTSKGRIKNIKITYRNGNNDVSLDVTQ